MSVKKKRTIGPCRGVTWLYRCRHGISSRPFISILAFVPSFSSIYICFLPEGLKTSFQAFLLLAALLSSTLCLGLLANINIPPGPF